MWEETGRRGRVGNGMEEREKEGDEVEKETNTCETNEVNDTWNEKKMFV